MTKPVTRKLRNQPLTKQQAQFVSFILAGLQPHQAAEQSGYARGDSRNYDSHKAASVLLSKPWIAQAIQAGREKQLAEKAAARPELSLNELIATFDYIGQQVMLEAGVRPSM